MLDGVDLVVAITVSWIPLAADYTRFARDRGSAFWGTAGRLLPRGHLALAARRVLFFSRDITDPAALPVAVAAGGVGAVLALLAVTVDETDEAFANVVLRRRLDPEPRAGAAAAGARGRRLASSRRSAR